MKPMPIFHLRHLVALTAAAASVAIVPAAALAWDDPPDVFQAQSSDQSAGAAATQVLPVNASVLPINANVPVCLSVVACSNSDNSADQRVLQSNSATASASNSSSQRQAVRHHHGH
jgi:hypothetical protein